MSEVFKRDEVRCFDKTEIMRLDTEYIVHQYPFVFSYAFPDVGRFASSRFQVYPLRLISVVFVDLIGHGHLYAARFFLCHVCHTETSVGQVRDVGIQYLDFRIGIFEEDGGFCHQAGKIVIRVGVIKFGFPFSFLADREINHHFLLHRVVSRFGSPCATDLSKFIGKCFVDTDTGVRPVYQIERLHQYQSPVVSPAIKFSVPFPFGCPVSFFFGKKMQVGHGYIESTVRTAIDMRITYAALFGYRIAGDNRLSVINSRKRITVTADSHKKAMCRVRKIDHQVSSHIFFRRYGMGSFSFRLGKDSEGQQ